MVEKWKWSFSLTKLDVIGFIIFHTTIGLSQVPKNILLLTPKLQKKPIQKQHRL